MCIDSIAGVVWLAVTTRPKAERLKQPPRRQIVGAHPQRHPFATLSHGFVEDRAKQALPDAFSASIGDDGDTGQMT